MLPLPPGTKAALPLETGRLISTYGWRNRPSGQDLHTGIDLGCAEGTRVFAVLPGSVRLALPSGKAELYGNLIVIEHAPDQLLSLYAHLRDMFVTEGETVEAGQVIGTAGRTAGTRADPGRLFQASRAHLHFEFLESIEALRAGNQDLYRLDPGPIFAELGIVVPERGEIMAAANSPASRPEPRPAPGYVANGRAGRKAGAGAGIAALALILIAFFYQQRQTG